MCVGMFQLHAVKNKTDNVMFMCIKPNFYPSQYPTQELQ